MTKCIKKKIILKPWKYAIISEIWSKGSNFKEWNKTAILEFATTTGLKTTYTIWIGHETFVFPKQMVKETLQIY